ncbi:Soluble cytochrome b562 [Moritella sp. JT01]|uniref:cytochrome b562 n=1 Tax=Moritella sp. JT01 TaxID=756698 RepID=UPI000793C0C2|nr:cytochrome b562 [Moritella sp. JT01]KXO07761.1 Soluble cytochrome b562 [Moritella sp. JT01]
MKNRFAQLGLIISLLFSTLVNSAEIDSIDLKVTMKQMRLAYTQAMKTTSADEFSTRIDEMSKMLAVAQSYNFSPDRAEMSNQGLDKVESILNSIQQANITDENLAVAKAKLEDVDSLRKEYHKKSKPSIWQLIFG